MSDSSRERLVFYMDLVQHDMLNANQAVLSYLELILTTPGLDKKALDYAKKAVSHVRSTGLRIENVNTIMNARKTSSASSGTADLWEMIGESTRELSSIFPSKKIKVAKSQQPGKATVVGGGLVKELLLTVMENVVRLDPGTEVTLSLKVSENPAYGKRGWTVTIEDPKVKLPAVVKDTDIDDVHTKDISLVAKVSGILFAKMVAETLGGDFNIEPRTGTDRGAAFVLNLRRAASR